MKVLNKATADEYRKLFIDTFADKSAPAYQNISNLFKCSDGLCYLNYIWDTFTNPLLISQEKALNILKSKKEFFIMWDIHSKDYIRIDNYWKYPKDSVLQLNVNEYLEKVETFPEDVYIFDESMQWAIALTHEEINNQRYCLYMKK